VSLGVINADTNIRTQLFSLHRKTLEIDCAEIYKASNESGLVTALAKQTGYWPVFSFLASANNMVDLAAMGLIGQKAGFSTSLEQQLKQILEVVGGALKQVNDTLHS
jgi:hypothetical protein